MLNNVSLVGRPTTDPELRYTQSGVAVANMNLAVKRNFKNADGEYDADFIRVTAWKERAEFLANFGRKGKLLSIGGRIETGSYENDNGDRVYTVEVNASDVSIIEWEEQPEQQTPTKKTSPAAKNNGNRNTGSRGNTAGKPKR